MAVDICLGIAAFFGLVLVTAPDRLTHIQKVIAGTLFVILIVLAVVLLAALAVGARRLIRRRAKSDPADTL